MLTYGALLLHNYARPYTVACTRAVLEHFNWELFDRIRYSSDLAPWDDHLFTYPKKFFGSQCFNNNMKLMEGGKSAGSQAADFFDTSIQKFIPRYKCLNSGVDYVEKSLKYASIFYIVTYEGLRD
jgi:hypothetical protein